MSSLLPLPVKVNSHVRLDVEVAVAGSLAVLSDDPQHGVRLAGDADDGSARATGTPTGGLEHGVMGQQAEVCQDAPWAGSAANAAPDGLCAVWCERRRGGLAGFVVLDVDGW
jgi:hypothetical protein